MRRNVVDRVETTSTVFLGLTLGCARCHDHKYDPFSQKEFYQLFAYFNNIPERGKANKYGNSAPMIQAPTVAQQAKLAEIDRDLAAAENRYERLRAESAKAQRAWEATLDKSPRIDWSIPTDLIAHFPLDGDLSAQVKSPLAAPSRQPQYDADAAPPPAPSKSVTPQFQEGEPQFSDGRIGAAASFDGTRFIVGGDIGNFGFQSKFTLAAWIYPTADTGAIVTRTKDAEEEAGYGLYLKSGKIQANLILRFGRWRARRNGEADRAQSLAPLMMTYDGSRTAEGITIYVDGRSQELVVHLDDLNQNFHRASRCGSAAVAALPTGSTG